MSGLVPVNADYGVRREGMELERSVRNIVRQEVAKKMGAWRMR